MSQTTPSIVALIPARAGSKRVADKNIKLLAGHPLIAYTIAAAQQSGIFAAVIVSTDSLHYVDMVKHYGAESPYLRPAEMSGDISPDIEWVSYTLDRLRSEGRLLRLFQYPQTDESVPTGPDDNTRLETIP